MCSFTPRSKPSRSMFGSPMTILLKAPRAYGRSFLYVETDENDLTCFIFAQLQVIKSAMDELHDYMDRKTDEIRQTESHLRASVSCKLQTTRSVGTCPSSPWNAVYDRVAPQEQRNDVSDFANRSARATTKAIACSLQSGKPFCLHGGRESWGTIGETAIGARRSFAGHGPIANGEVIATTYRFGTNDPRWDCAGINGPRCAPDEA